MHANVEVPHGLFDMSNMINFDNMCANVEMPHGLLNMTNMANFD
jgi:hypothetical protein